MAESNSKEYSIRDFIEGDVKVDNLGDITGKTLIFTIARGIPVKAADEFKEKLEDIFPEAKNIIIMIGDFVKKIDILD